MGDEGVSYSRLGGRLGEHVAEILEAAASDAAAMAARVEAERRELLNDAHDEARRAFAAAAEASRSAGEQRARKLAELRRTIAERSESLAAEADEPDVVRRQVEALLRALAATEAALELESTAVRWPDPPALGGETAAEPVTDESRQEDAEPAEERTGDAFARWRRSRLDGQLLAIMRMAVGGKTRDEIERELDPALPPEERSALLDHAFGSEPTPENGRVARADR